MPFFRLFLFIFCDIRVFFSTGKNGGFSPCGQNFSIISLSKSFFLLDGSRKILFIDDFFHFLRFLHFYMKRYATKHSLSTMLYSMIPSEITLFLTIFFSWGYFGWVGLGWVMLGWVMLGWVGWGWVGLG